MSERPLCKYHPIEETSELSTSISPPGTDFRDDYGEGAGSSNFEIYRMLRTVAAWLILTEVANSVRATEQKMEVPSLWVKSSLPLSV